MLLCLSVGDDQMIHLAETDTVAKMWENLKTIHEVKGQQTIIALKRAMFRKAATKDSDIPAHLIEMKHMRAKLHQMGCLLPETEFRDVLISSLPKSWDGFVSTFLGARTGAEDSGQSHTNLQERMALIKDEYERRIGGASNKRKLNEGDEQIYYLESSGKRRQVEGGTCTICGGKGHLAKVCCFKGKPKCGNCKRFGHATNCYARRTLGRSSEI